MKRKQANTPFTQTRSASSHLSDSLRFNVGNHLISKNDFKMNIVPTTIQFGVRNYHPTVQHVHLELMKTSMGIENIWSVAFVGYSVVHDIIK